MTFWNNFYVSRLRDFAVEIWLWVKGKLIVWSNLGPVSFSSKMFHIQATASNFVSRVEACMCECTQIVSLKIHNTVCSNSLPRRSWDLCTCLILYFLACGPQALKLHSLVTHALRNRKSFRSYKYKTWSWCVVRAILQSCIWINWFWCEKTGWSSHFSQEK